MEHGALSMEHGGMGHRMVFRVGLLYLPYVRVCSGKARQGKVR